MVWAHQLNEEAMKKVWYTTSIRTEAENSSVWTESNQSNIIRLHSPEVSIDKIEKVEKKIIWNTPYVQSFKSL